MAAISAARIQAPTITGLTKMGWRPLSSSWLKKTNLVYFSRCGTSFLFIAVLVTWILFLFMSPKSILIRIITRIAMLPVVAGVAYEVLKHSARREGAVWGLVKAPGIAMQKLTTREPDKGQLRVAATSLVLLIAEEHGLEFTATAGQDSEFRKITEEPVTGSDFKEKE